MMNTNRCPTCGAVVPTIVEHVDAECEKWEGLISAFHMGDMGDVEFTELALAAGMSLERIGNELKAAREDDGEDAIDGAEGDL